MEVMDVQQYEVEVKTLLGDDATTQTFIRKLQQSDPDATVKATSDQLNHYFDKAGDPAKLLEVVKGALSEGDWKAFSDIVSQSQSFALRTRQDDKVRLVIKAAKTGDDEQHALERLEGEYVTAAASIDELDAIIQQAGYGFLSKWSRARTEYAYKDYNVCIDRNAGYGYVAEIEKIVSDQTAAAEARKEILAELDSLGFEELSQERVGRMFAHYNDRWPEYYRTDKTFNVS